LHTGGEYDLKGGRGRCPKGGNFVSKGCRCGMARRGVGPSLLSPWGKEGGEKSRGKGPPQQPLGEEREAKACRGKGECPGDIEKKSRTHTTFL